MTDSSKQPTTTGPESTMNEAAASGPRTPSMFASWMVIVVMIALILLSVALFGGDMADGARQVSITLATIFALAVAYYYG